MRLYDGDRGFYCFACGAGGDAVTLATRLLELPPHEAARRIGADFGLNLPNGRPNRTALRAGRRRVRLEEAFEMWRRDAEQLLCDYHRALRQAQSKYAPASSGEAFHPLFELACREADRAEWALDCIDNDPMAFYKSDRDYIAEVETRLEQLHGQ